METIYSLYEAKRLAQVVPGVGEATSIDVMYPDGKLMSWTEALDDRCRWLFDRIGPKLEINEKKWLNISRLMKKSIYSRSMMMRNIKWEAKCHAGFITLKR